MERIQLFAQQDRPADMKMEIRRDSRSKRSGRPLRSNGAGRPRGRSTADRLPSKWGAPPLERRTWSPMVARAASPLRFGLRCPIRTDRPLTLPGTTFARINIKVHPAPPRRAGGAWVTCGPDPFALSRSGIGTNTPTLPMLDAQTKLQAHRCSAAGPSPITSSVSGDSNE